MVPPKAIEGDRKVLVLWDFIIQTNRVLDGNKPDVTVVGKSRNKNQCLLIYVAVPGLYNIKVIDKLKKYTDVRIEFATM